MTKGRSIRMFLVDGTPSGIITAEIMNWTGHVMVAPRSRLADLIQREEAGRTGVYFLSGADPDGGSKPVAYIGETDNVAKRLAQHNKDAAKDFWDRVCFVTSKDQNLTKAHIRYLEGRLIAVAASAGRAKLLNGTAPDYGLLPEADIADMEFFLEQIRIVLPVLGMDFLRDVPKPSTRQQEPEADDTAAEEPITFELTSRKHGVTATAREVDGDFVVLAGSTARAELTHTGNPYRALREELASDGTLQPGGAEGLLVFTRDTSFRSPSAAAASVLGRADNGRTSWKQVGTGLTYAALQEAQVDAVTTQESEE